MRVLLLTLDDILQKKFPVKGFLVIYWGLVGSYKSPHSQMGNSSTTQPSQAIPRYPEQRFNWFQVLYDTLLAWEIPPFTKTINRKSIETAKFYFFDTGVVRALRTLGRTFLQQKSVALTSILTICVVMQLDKFFFEMRIYVFKPFFSIQFTAAMSSVVQGLLRNSSFRLLFSSHSSSV